MTETETKSVSKSVSMPERLWAEVETRAPHTPGGDRSGYIRNLVEADLRQHHGIDQLIELVREAQASGVNVAEVLTRAKASAKK